MPPCRGFALIARSHRLTSLLRSSRVLRDREYGVALELGRISFFLLAEA